MALRPATRAATVASVLLSSTIVTACGGGDAKQAATTTTTVTTATSVRPAPPRPQLPAVRQAVRRATTGKTQARFGPETSAAPGDVVVLLTTFRAQDKIAGKGLRLTIPATGARRLQVEARGPNGLTSSSTIAAKGAGRIRLTELKYTCLVPGQTFCPVALKQRGQAYVARLTVPAAGAPVALAARVVAEKSKAKPQLRRVPRGTATPIVKLLAHRAKPEPTKSFTQAVRASSGAIVQVVPQIVNYEAAAGQRFEVRIPKARGSKLTLRAGAAGAPLRSTATIESPNGRPIKIVGLRYNCTPEPATICPLRIDERGGQYRVRGSAPMVVGMPIVLAVTLGAG